MRLEKSNLENLMLDYVDQIKILISPEIWENILLDCSKNEILILILLYRNKEVNMTQIAEYIDAPLNTATGIISRMEQKKMVVRERSLEDKRVVTIVLSENGHIQIQRILKEFIHYGSLLIDALTKEELELTGKILDKIIYILKNEQTKTTKKQSKKIKKIDIQ